MTPEQAQVWTRYHKASEMLADATDELILAEQSRRAGLICNTARAEQVARGCWQSTGQRVPPWKHCARPVTLRPRLARLSPVETIGH